jgi:hypothetical protein
VICSKALLSTANIGCSISYHLNSPGQVQMNPEIATFQIEIGLIRLANVLLSCQRMFDDPITHFSSPEFRFVHFVLRPTAAFVRTGRFLRYDILDPSNPQQLRISRYTGGWPSATNFLPSTIFLLHSFQSVASSFRHPFAKYSCRTSPTSSSLIPFSLLTAAYYSTKEVRNSFGTSELHR